MKLSRLALLPALLFAAGCLDIEIKLRDPLAVPNPPPATVREAVTADQVTPENARAMAQRLWDEFDQEEIGSP